MRALSGLDLRRVIISVFLYHVDVMKRVGSSAYLGLALDEAAEAGVERKDVSLADRGSTGRVSLSMDGAIARVNRDTASGLERLAQSWPQERQREGSEVKIQGSGELG